MAKDGASAKRTRARDQALESKAQDETPPNLRLVEKVPAKRRRQRNKTDEVPTYRDQVVHELLGMVGEGRKAEPLSKDRVTEILPDTPQLITYQDLNEVLMFYGLGTISEAFFDHFFGSGFQTIDSLREGVTRIRKYSLLFYGNFRRGFDDLRRAKDGSMFQRPPWDLTPLRTRAMHVERIKSLSAEESYATGYLTATDSMSPQQIGKARKKATANAERYMAMNGVDVYVAGSMREKRDFEEAAQFVDALRQSAAVTGLSLSIFNPLWAYVPDSQQKGLLEVLMLKKASAMLFLAGRKDSFGKDSELSTMLVQGKPVIVYLPAVGQDDDRHDDFERQYRMFLSHPLAMQCDLNTGVANGIMIARNVETCAQLLGRLFTNTMEFNIDDSNENNHYLREVLTGSKVRVVTKNPLLTESFWQQYLGDDPRRFARTE